VKTMPKYLVELILIVETETTEEARKIADYIVNLPIPQRKIENAIETLRYEEIAEIRT